MKLKEIVNREIGPNNKEQKKLTQNSSLYSADDLIEDLFLGYNESPKFKKNKFLELVKNIIIGIGVTYFFGVIWLDYYLAESFLP